jgi:hypothetical protein
VAAIGVAQEFQRVFTGTAYHADEGGGRILRQNLTDNVASRRVIETNSGRVDDVPLLHTTP